MQCRLTFHIFHLGSSDWSLRGTKTLHYCLHAVVSKRRLPIVFFNYSIKINMQCNEAISKI